MRLQQQGHEHQRRRGRCPLQHRHFQYQATDPARGPHRGQQAHVRPERDAAEHHLIDPEFVQQAQYLVGVDIHPVGTGVPGLVAAAVTQQVEQHDAITLGGQPPGQPVAEVGVEQQAVQPHQDPVARAVNLIGKPVLTVGHGVPRTVGTGLGVLASMLTRTDALHDLSASRPGVTGSEARHPGDVRPWVPASDTPILLL